jgi:2-hydroxyglutarate dehydrogenase
VIGGGAVGLAIARRLAQRDGAGTVLIEKNGAVGMETSSRNSEVVHAGLYYGPESLKTRLCVQGREMLYELCDRFRVPYRRTGKWVVAQTEQQLQVCFPTECIVFLYVY